MSIFHWLQNRRTQKRVEEVRKLVLNDLDALGSLLAAWHSGEASVCEEAEKGLLRLLPRLNEQDAARLPSSHRQYLHELLRSDNKELALTVLHALERVGDVSAIPAIERYILREWGRWKDEPAVRETAQRCLPLLKKRDFHMIESLLRPSTPPPPPEFYIREVAPPTTKDTK